jgi:hypothetical protein
LTRLAAIHQPTFLPWLGWWDKFLRADVLVLLDDVQFPKKGGTWMNRVRLLVGEEPAWITVPVDRAYSGVRSVREMLIDETKPWRARILATVEASYRSAPHFNDVYPVIVEALDVETTRISALNQHAIGCISARLGQDAGKVVRQSDLRVHGQGTELLVSLCNAVRANAYLNGDGAAGYLVEEEFVDAGLRLVQQHFAPPQYAQRAPRHVPGLSIVDALMSCGWDGTKSLLAR